MTKDRTVPWELKWGDKVLLVEVGGKKLEHHKKLTNSELELKITIWTRICEADKVERTSKALETA